MPRPRGVSIRILPALLLTLLLALAACAPRRPALPARTYGYPVFPGEVLDLALGRPLREGELGPRLTQARLVFVGEQHDEVGSHRFQSEVIQALIGQGREVHVVLEMFPPHADEALEEWSQGKLDEREFLSRSGWYEHWGFPWAFYRELFLMFRERGLTVRGINVTREQRSLAAEGTLAPELREEVGDLDLTVEPHQRFLSDALNELGHGDGPLRMDSPEFDRYLRIQVLWDHVMGTRAARLAQAASSREVIVALLGSGHLAYGLGANLRAARAQPDLLQITLLDRYVQRDQLGPNGRLTVPVGLADLVRVDILQDEARKPGSLAALRLSPAEGGVRVDSVRALAPSTLRAFKAGDLIESLNGRSYGDPVELRLAYEALPPDSSAHWSVRREGMPVPMTLRVKASK
jgi:uncharacterized iron-regulated protein